jgi:hypothetical protein
MSKKEEILQNIDNSITKINNKEQRIIFMVPDTKGNARASIAVIYRQAMTLMNLGYDTAILLEKKDSVKPGVWLGDRYDSLQHYSVEENNMSIGAQDFIVIPEVFGTVFEQVEKLPMEKVLFVQSFEYLLDSYAPGSTFLDRGVTEVLTTSDQLATLIKDLVPLQNVGVIPIGIPDYFQPSENLQKPIVAIHCREARKAAKIIKSFYLKYPIYRFVSFKDMHTMSEKDFAKNLKDCCLSIWVDEESSFGTFPVESIKCNIPVIGKVPTIIPEWMDDNNGMWVYDENQIPDLTSTYLKNWLEDNIQDSLKTVATSLEGKYTMAEFESETKDVWENFFTRRIGKLQAIKTEYLKNNQ